MKNADLNPQLINKILKKTVPAFMKNGLKGTTMDAVASSLQISKRTLYELFGSKDNLFREAHKYIHNKMANDLINIFNNSANVMEAIIKCFLYHRDLMSDVSADFINDMEQLVIKDNTISESQRRHHYQNLYDVLQRGVREGFFRQDINLNVQCRMLFIQMESLKRTEELFPPDISLLEVYDNIIMGFLRGISSHKGLEEIEKFMPAFTAKFN